MAREQAQNEIKKDMDMLKEEIKNKKGEVEVQFVVRPALRSARVDLVPLLLLRHRLQQGTKAISGLEGWSSKAG